MITQFLNGRLDVSSFKFCSGRCTTGLSFSSMRLSYLSSSVELGCSSIRCIAVVPDKISNYYSYELYYFVTKYRWQTSAVLKMMWLSGAAWLSRKLLPWSMLSILMDATYNFFRSNQFLLHSFNLLGSYSSTSC